jgi:hypothetical protein
VQQTIVLFDSRSTGDRIAVKSEHATQSYLSVHAIYFIASLNCFLY